MKRFFMILIMSLVLCTAAAPAATAQASPVSTVVDWVTFVDEDETETEETSAAAGELKDSIAWILVLVLAMTGMSGYTISRRKKAKQE